jgi:endonuclease-3
MTQPEAAAVSVPPAEPGDRRVAEIFRRFEAINPAPKPELNYVDRFTLLVSVVLSAQATDVSVNKATGPLFQIAPDPARMAELGVEGLTPLIQSIGLFNTKAKNVVALANLLLDQHNGEVPLERTAMQALPGVGRKTASVVLNELGVEPAIAVDTHVYRVSHRLRLSLGMTPDAVEADLMRVVPASYLTRAHHWLILHGRYICVARRPRCEGCPLADLCPTAPLYLDAPSAKTTSTKRRPRSGA